MSDATPADLHHILDSQRAAFLQDGPPDLKQRRADLRRLKAEILKRRTEIVRALKTDFGQRSERESAIVELIPLVQSINYMIAHLGCWMKPERRHVSAYFQCGRAWVVRQPVGVVGIIAPWNYPVSLALVPLATAIAAGNRAMLKPSEFTPATSAVIGEIVQAIFPPEQISVVTGGGDVGAAFSALPFDHILFTGSTAVGKKVAEAAARNLTPVTLELGGKSPVVIAPGFSMQRVADRVAFGKLTNAGQTCIAPDYVLVHENDRDAFATAYQDAVKKQHPGGYVGSPDYTAILNAHHYGRLSGLIDHAEAQGARVIRLGSDSATDHILAPVLLLDVTPQMAVMQEEIFGPVLPVLTYRTLEEAIAFINARPRPLALYYFGGNRAERDRVLKNTVSGNVTVNGTLMHYVQDDLPFGGVGDSGIGAYHGKEGFMALTHARGVYRQGRFNAATLLQPPFGRLADTITNLILR
ncbi:putative coniferyl aldehyde dehydrogenase [Gluconacetobacter sp. SXCC-1]|uniref:Aldehyde dehydrogenase n=1 Tax=Komagataeibacter rhaeticus TaxID=215221 RepID=A0A181CBG8_9PROT|nr:coniferyl aldehyde dehydrogenase [Komagataeibacter rhaeticus]ATU72455.1 coniferyl aldehyde dehydrogenase [Komagataeibacter xylinus]EGG74781.1 putative coniferyl aldehyde dehydrogenase [Gluconacetobacter sp. SXCC-1]QIP35633.1 coniferyl aldehyde dehydrogenase [Komagataeibacter rhaeticus]WPP22204.1 coniferyl aldehyde dehydrogenase [Komagataeibacter rhaeticus]SAY48886.1 Coniferyl aldehyde dehydrogenase [Komagataeibacter rhaeticus]